MFQGQKPRATTRLPEVSSSETNRDSLTYVMRFGAKANVLCHKIADHVTKKGSDVNENSTSESIRC